MKEKAPYTNFTLIRKLLVFAVPYKKLYWLAIVLTIVASVLSPLRPYLIRMMVDEAIATRQWSLLHFFFGLILSLLILETVVQFFQNYLSNLLAQHIIFDIRKKVFASILRFNTSFFDKTPVGTIVTRVVSDIETVADVFSQGLMVLAGDILQILLVLFFMFYTDWRLTFISLIPIPLLLLATNIFRKYIRKAFQEVRTQVAQLNTFINEHITGMSVVQAFNSEEREMEKFKTINARHRDAHIKTVWAYSIFFPVVEILSAFSLALLVGWGTRGALEGYVTMGNLVAFILYIYMLFRPIRILADRFNTLQMGLVSMERIFTLLDAYHHIELSGRRIATRFQGLITFNNVTFSYNPNEPVLHKINFEIKPGSMVALVGHTGSGKSTLVNLLLRMYEFQQGEILVDGTSIREYELESYRSRFAYVPQEVFLFSGSIYENITMYNSNISQEHVKKAACEIGIDTFISRLPGGYNYQVRERGVSLSVGQRQLIAFLRAYVQQPDILILDEATSSVDSETEQLIQRATEIITSGRTSIIIAHRLSTVIKADNIMVLDRGRVVEQGSHAFLLEKGEIYRRLCQLQFADV